MKKTALMSAIAAAGRFEPTTASVARFLGITSETVRAWPETVTHQVLRGVAGDFVRIGVRVPAEIREEMRRLFARG